MTYKEFYVWLDGFMTNRSWTTIKQVDIESIQEKMKEVKDDSKEDIKNFLLKRECETRTQLFGTNPIEIKPRKDDDDLGKPPRIVM